MLLQFTPDKTARMFCPKKFQFEGSNDGRNYEIIFYDGDMQKRCKPEEYVTRSFNNGKAYKYYRLHVLDVAGERGYRSVVVRDLKLFGTPMKGREINQGHLIPSLKL